MESQFQINFSLLRNLGWSDNHPRYGVNKLITAKNITLFDVRYDQVLISRYLFYENFIIYEYECEKESNKKIIYAFSNTHTSNNPISFGLINPQVSLIKSNLELIKLIIKHKAYNDVYKRHFKIKGILKKQDDKNII